MLLLIVLYMPNAPRWRGVGGCSSLPEGIQHHTTLPLPQYSPW